MAGLTLNTGLSFSGGFAFTEAPPTTNTEAWFGGGYSPYGSTVNRITYATDTNTASVRGPLSSVRYFLSATGNTTNAWFGGGDGPGGGSGPKSTVNRITYATDTATASVRGPLSGTKWGVGAAGNTTDGWFGGGYGDGSAVDRITYATDTATASVRGPLSVSFYSSAAAGNYTYGWWGGAWTGSGFTTTVNRITYATDTATASVRGPLSLARNRAAATGNSDYGWWGGGKYVPGPTYFSRVDRITYATDTATASVRGPLSGSKSWLAAAGNTTDGWFGGGYGGGSTVDRITYATDTTTASVRGPLSSAGVGIAAASNIQL